LIERRWSLIVGKETEGILGKETEGILGKETEGILGKETEERRPCALRSGLPSGPAPAARLAPARAWLLSSAALQRASPGRAALR